MPGPESAFDQDKMDSELALFRQETGTVYASQPVPVKREKRVPVKLFIPVPCADDDRFYETPEEKNANFQGSSYLAVQRDLVQGDNYTLACLPKFKHQIFKLVNPQVTLRTTTWGEYAVVGPAKENDVVKAQNKLAYARTVAYWNEKASDCAPATDEDAEDADLLTPVNLFHELRMAHPRLAIDGKPWDVETPYPSVQLPLDEVIKRLAPSQKQAFLQALRSEDPVERKQCASFFERLELVVHKAAFKIGTKISDKGKRTGFLNVNCSIKAQQVKKRPSAPLPPAAAPSADNSTPTLPLPPPLKRSKKVIPTDPPVLSITVD